MRHDQATWNNVNHLRARKFPCLNVTILNKHYNQMWKQLKNTLFEI